MAILAKNSSVDGSINVDQGGLQGIDPSPVHIMLAFVFHAVFLLIASGGHYIHLDMARRTQTVHLDALRASVVWQ
jgi:hypothetical protein